LLLTSLYLVGGPAASENQESYRCQTTDFAHHSGDSIAALVPILPLKFGGNNVRSASVEETVPM